MLVTPNIMGVAVPMILISVFLFINLSHISYRYGLLFYFNTYDIIMLSHIYLKGVGMSTRMVITIDENLKDLAEVKNSELLDKKVVKRKSEATLIMDKEMSVQEELVEYLNYILEINPDKIPDIIGTYNDYTTNVEMV